MQCVRNPPVIPSIRIVNGNAQLELSLPGVGRASLDPVTKFDSSRNQKRIVGDRLALRSATRFQLGGIGKLLWGPSLIGSLYVRNIHQ